MTFLLPRNIFCKTSRLRSIALISSLVSMIFTVFACGSNGGIFSTSENTRNSFGIISIPLGALFDDFTLPTIPIHECSFSLDYFSLISSEQSPAFASI